MMMSVVANISKASKHTAITKSLKRCPQLSTSFSFSSSKSSNKNGELPKDFLQENLATEGEWAHCSRKFMAPLQVPVRGPDILNDPLYNKGTAFKTGERDRLRFREFLSLYLNRLVLFCSTFMYLHS